MTFHLYRNESIPDGLRRIAHEQIGMAISLRDDDSIPLPQKVHGLRTRCKKMRGLLRLASPSMDDEFKQADRQFREAAKRLALSRDVDIYAKSIEALGGPAAEATELSTKEANAAINESCDILAQALSAVDDWPLDLDGFVDIGPGFAKTYRKCVAAWRDVRKEPSDETYHRLRKWAKYHWYHIRILERINKQELHKRREWLRKLQLELGDAHDMAVLQAMLESESTPDKELLRRATARKRELYKDAAKHSKKVFAPSTDELVADLSVWWADWKH